MISTHLLRCQHSDAHMMIDRLLMLLDGCERTDNAAQISKQLAKLTQLMRVHFAQEDHWLYPSLMASADPEVVEAASSFHREMGELWEQYEAFVRGWSTLSAIVLRFDRFKVDCVAVFAAIEDRCARENELLFPLADAAGQARFAA